MGLPEHVYSEGPYPKRQVCQFEHKDFILPWEAGRALPAWPRHREAFSQQDADVRGIKA